VCRSKHVEPSINSGIINSITKLHLVGISTKAVCICVLSNGFHCITQQRLNSILLYFNNFMELWF